MTQIKTAIDMAAISQLLADDIHTQLVKAIDARGKASIALSGGTSPARCMQLLSEKDLDWSKVTITLSDERWLPEDHPRSNHLLIKNNMLINKAKDSHFLPLYCEAENIEDGAKKLQKTLEESLQPSQGGFDVCLLGMGADGHFASLFPDSEQLSDGLTSDNLLIAVESPSVPEKRISMTLNCITKASKIYLLIAGKEKCRILQNVLDQKEGRPNLPIESLVSATDLHVFKAGK